MAHVARLLGAPADWVRRFARDGLLEATRTERGHYLLSFRDIVLLRTARRLSDRLTTRRVRRALRTIERQLPQNTSLSGVRIRTEGRELVVSDGHITWSPDSGQVLFDFECGGAEITPLADAERSVAARLEEADRHYKRGVAIDEGTADHEAFEHYQAALALDPEHAAARINIGRLYHRAGQIEEAEGQYRIALLLAPSSATAAFNLGVALEDLQRFEAALDAYDSALEADPSMQDAHFNAASVCRTLGHDRRAIDHLARYRRLTFRMV